jgi:biopolymer transport protein ExbD
MARKRRVMECNAGELNLVAMIDVAFQLLSFFLITVHPVDVMTNLDIFRPSPEAPPPVQTEPVDLLDIIIYKDGYVLKGTDVNIREVERQLAKVASISKNVSVIIKCTGDSVQQGLVNVLDVCAKTGLTKIAVFSL